MAFAASYRDLVVYQKSRALAKDFFEIKVPPDCEILEDPGARKK